MSEEGSVFGLKPKGKLFGNSSDDLDLRHTCSWRQFNVMPSRDFSEDCLGDLVNFGMTDYGKFIDKPEILSLMFHNVTACYVYMYMEFLRFQAVKLPVIQNNSIESIPDSETAAGSSLVCQEVVQEQHSTVHRESCKTSDNEDRGVSMQQTADIKDEKLKNISPYDLYRMILKWFDGAGNIPLHIRGKLTYLPAMLHSGIPHLYDAIVCPISLSAQDLNLFTLFISRFRGQKYYGNLLNTTGQGHKELKCCGSGLAAVDVKKKCSVEDIYKKDRTKNKDEDKTSHGKFDQERAGIKVNVTYVNKASCRTKPGEVLSLSTGTRNSPSFKQWVWVILSLLLLVVKTNQSPVRDKGGAISTESAVFHNFPLLLSWCPNPEENVECPNTDKIFEWKTESCEYRCRSFEDIKCMDSKSGAVYFCVPKNTTCAKGLGWQIEKIEHSVDDPSKVNVVVKESACSEGFYQTEQSKCYNACRTRHIRLDIIPEGFKIFSKGDHIHPTTVMCDYTAGYYNADNKSSVNFDSSFSLHYGFCTHVNVSNPCSSGQMPLYNGTCVNLCGQGFERDETDYKCKEISGKDDTSGTTSTERPATTGTVKSTKATTGRNLGSSPEKNRNSTEFGKTQQKSHTVLIVIIIVVAVLFVVMLIIVAVFIYKFICRGNNQTNIYQLVPARQNSAQNDSNKSSASCIADESTIDAEDRKVSVQTVEEVESLPSNLSFKADESTIDAEDRKVSVQTVEEVESLPSNLSFKDDESTIDESPPDVEPASIQTVDELESLPRSPSSAGPTPKTVVKKKAVYSGNITIKIDNVGVINFGCNGENVQDIIKELCRGLHIPLSDVAKVEGSENDLRDNGTDTVLVEEMSGKDAEQIKETESTGPEEKRSAGEEFALPNNNTMTQMVVNGFAEYMKSVGALIYNGVVIGTVFRAGADYVITAFHVIKRIIDPNQIGEFDYTLLEAANVYLNFNATVCQSPPCFEYRVCHKFSSNNGRFDFTVLQITNPNRDLPQKMKLDRHNHDRLQVNTLAGIGYGDPVNSFCKVLDPICPIISSVNSRILKCEQWLYAEDNKNFNCFRRAVIARGSNPDIVTKGYKDIDRVQNIFLDISMEHKGSGSPFMTNDGKVVGILTHGHPEFYFLLPAIIRPGVPKDKRFETVLKLEYVYEHIFERDPDLAKNLFGEV